MQLARNAKQIGNEIRRQRKQMGLTQTTLAETAGLRQATISEIESGYPAARLETILSVLAALNLEFQITKRSYHSPQDIEDSL
jgi:HTH-type transcriptional regulator/antitoxin HipB